MTRTVKILFTISVLLNVLLLGASAGLALKMSHKPWHKMPDNLSPETQNLMERSFQESRNEMQPTIEDMKEARADLARVFSAPSFDEAQFDRAVDQMMTAQRQLMQKRFEATKEMAQQLSQEEREKLAEVLSKPFGGFHHSKRMYDHPPKPQD